MLVRYFAGSCMSVALICTKSCCIGAKNNTKVSNQNISLFHSTPLCCTAHGRNCGQHLLICERLSQVLGGRSGITTAIFVLFCVRPILLTFPEYPNYFFNNQIATTDVSACIAENI